MVAMKIRDMKNNKSPGMDGFPPNSTKESNQNDTKTQDISYEMRLKECGLTTLETRRLRTDQIEVLTFLNGYGNIDRNMFSRSKKREGLEDMELH